MGNSESKSTNHEHEDGGKAPLDADQSDVADDGDDVADTDDDGEARVEAWTQRLESAEDFGSLADSSDCPPCFRKELQGPCARPFVASYLCHRSVKRQFDSEQAASSEGEAMEAEKNRKESSLRGDDGIEGDEESEEDAERFEIEVDQCGKVYLAFAKCVQAHSEHYGTRVAEDSEADTDSEDGSERDIERKETSSK